MAGNIAEWTMEVYHDTYRAGRGGIYYDTPTGLPLGSYCENPGGFRIALYMI